MRIKTLFFILFCSLWQNCIAEITTLPSLIQAEMITGVYSERSEIGDKVQVKLKEPINLVNERVFIPIESVIEGQIIEIHEAERGFRSGKAKVAFNRVYYPNGYFMDLEGYLADTLNSEEIKGKTSWRQKLLQIGKVGAGAVLGGPIGAAAATGTLIFDKGGKIRIAPGSLIQIKLNTLKMPQNYNIQGKITDIYSPQIPAN